MKRLHLTLNMSGKMEGMTSINTSCRNNHNCQNRINAAAFLMKKLNVKDKKDLKKRLKAGKIDSGVYNIMICWFCYADSMLAYRTGVSDCFDRNMEILADHLLTEEEIPLWPTFYGRVEAFGDVESEKNGGVIQARNYIRIAKYNPRTKFAAWSKNPGIWEKAFDQEGKPENLLFVQSGSFIDRVEKPANKYVDRVFTVWSTEEKAAAAGYSINCGKKKCLQCLNCYEKRDILYINELLK